MDEVNWVKAYYLDASAIVKFYVQEKGSDTFRAFFNSRAGFCVTQLCFGEALGILKNKAKYGHISQVNYFSACNDLSINIWSGRIELEDIPLADPSTAKAVESIALAHEIDLGDALQLYTIKNGRYSKLGPNSSPTLITADLALANAARAMNIRTWNCLTEAKPSWA